ncbi:MAG TPA: four helix bundle protein [Anaerolineales bacterium]|jgi:four helix bundle protein|nr:four helix bundle protein [Anaerolineales bacterium]
MSGSVYEKSFRELVVYQKSRLLSREIFMHTKFFPKDEMYFLNGQIRRASRLIGANIAEAWANRRNEARFISLLTDADGEQMETQHWVEVANDCGYMDSEASVQLVKRCAEMGRILHSMIEKAALFNESLQTASEETAEYFIGTTNWSLPVNNQVE